MPIEIKITGDTMVEINAAFKGMVGLNANTASLDDLLAITSARFAKEGFKITVDEASKPAAPMTAAEAVAREAAAVLADSKASQEELDNAAEELSRAEEQIVTAEPPKRKRGRPPKAALNEPRDDEEEEVSNVVTMAKAAKPDPDGDRTYVLDTLSERFADNKQKVRTKAFIDRVAGRNGGIRLSRLPPELFPAIRQEMDAYFNTGNNGGGHAA